jgi:hypothetical protein
MTVTAHSYTKLALSLGTKKIDFTADTFKVMLLSAYTVGTTQDTAQFVSDVLAVGAEASGTGYTAGGLAIPSPTFTESGHVYTFGSAGTLQWTSSTITASYALFYDSTPGSNATNPVLAYWDFGGAQSSSAGTFTLSLTGNAIATITGS